MDTKVLTAHVPLQLADQVDRLAASLERPRGWVVKEALLAWVEQEERRHAMTLEALESIDAGMAVPHDDVVGWAKRLGTDEAVAPPRTRQR